MMVSPSHITVAGRALSTVPMIVIGCMVQSFAFEFRGAAGLVQPVV